MSDFRWDLYDPGDGRLRASSDAVAAANERYPNDTRHARTQRRAFIEGWAAGFTSCGRRTLEAIRRDRDIPPGDPLLTILVPSDERVPESEEPR